MARFLLILTTSQEQVSTPVEAAGAFVLAGSQGAPGSDWGACIRLMEAKMMWPVPV